MRNYRPFRVLVMFMSLNFSFLCSVLWTIVSDYMCGVFNIDILWTTRNKLKIYTVCTYDALVIVLIDQIRHTMDAIWPLRLNHSVNYNYINDKYCHDITENCWNLYTHTYTHCFFMADSTQPSHTYMCWLTRLYLCFYNISCFTVNRSSLRTIRCYHRGCH